MIVPQGMTAEDYTDPPEPVTCSNCFAVYGDDKTECPFCEADAPEGQTVIEVPTVAGGGEYARIVVRIFGIPIPASNIKVDYRRLHGESLRPCAHSTRYEAFK